VKLRIKLLLAPLLTASVALGAGATYAVIDWHESQAARVADAAEVANFKTVGQAQEQLSQVRGTVFRTLALLASLDDAAAKAARADVAQQVAGIRRVVAAMPGNSRNDAEVTQAAAAAQPLLDQYARQCDRAIDLSGTDPNIGIGAMRAAEATYADAAKVMLSLHARNETLRNERADGAEARKLHLSAALGVLMAAATLAALFAAWRIQRGVVGDLARAVGLAQAVADGQLQAQPDSAREDEIGELQRALAHMIGRLTDSLQTVRVASDSIGTAALQIASGNTDLSQRTEQAASSLQETAGSMEQLASTVRQTADAARNAHALAASASGVAQRGGEVVGRVVSTMSDIHASARRIGDITSTIDGIAFQTNILALNAAVEAARAGEQGRGFAVVAAEVRSLAQRSATAAREIKSLIGASVDSVEAGAQLVGQAGSTMGEIVTSVQRVTDLVGQISTAAGEQSGGIGQISTAVSGLDRMTQQNAALVEESAAAAESLREQAVRLSEVVNRFQLDSPHAGQPRQAWSEPAPAAMPATATKLATAETVAPAAAPATTSASARSAAPSAATQATPARASLATAPKPRVSAPAPAQPPTAEAKAAKAPTALTRPEPATVAAGSDDWETF
jgi:methyl-accepting chemotaxis protein